jgi:hypothetical protein
MAGQQGSASLKHQAFRASWRGVYASAQASVPRAPERDVLVCVGNVIFRLGRTDMSLGPNAALRPRFLICIRGVGRSGVVCGVVLGAGMIPGTHPLVETFVKGLKKVMTLGVV